MNFFKPKRMRSRGNPKPFSRTASNSLAISVPQTVSTATPIIFLQQSSVVAAIYSTTNQTAPATPVDSFTFIINSIRVSFPADTPNRLDFFDIKTNAAYSDYGTYASRANVGISYGAAQRETVSSASADVTLAVVTATPVLVGTDSDLLIEFSVNVSVSWRNSQDGSVINAAISDAKEAYKLAQLRDMFSSAGLSFSDSMSVDSSTSLSTLTLHDDNKLKRTSSKFMGAFKSRASGRASAEFDYNTGR